ncbi:MAG: HEAT repeat domain-containing protein [Acidobacteriia bacterium]|nr:HEAT repeat domain-containing protein [Terriglobia bacterium]
MAVSQRAFLIRLYEEYLEEASFLYSQRRALLGNDEIPWQKLAGFEERLEAQIDGLAVGGALALETAAARAAEGDAGELFAALCVFCRQGSRERALTALERLDPAAAEKACAAGDALKYELPDGWVPDLLTLLELGDPKLAPVLARAFGYRRVPCGPQLMAAMRRSAASALPELVWALGRIGHEPAAECLLDYMRSEDAPVRSAAGLALARMGDTWGRFPTRQSGQVGDLPHLLALAGGRDAVGILSGAATADATAALGFLGAPECVPALLSRLERPDTAAPASSALECLTGAGLYETVFVPEEVKEDELFESEREALQAGKPPDRGDGRPFGSEVTRVSREPRRWQDWWSANSSRFTPGVRYRGGAPLSPARLVDLLAAPRTPHEIRRFSGEELAARYAEDFGFEPDMPAARQAALLAGAAAAGTRMSFVEGGWYRGGRRVD